jgi:hypothetical protein
MPIERLTDMAQNGPMRAADFNQELDRITMYLQEVRRDMDRSLRFGILGNSPSPELSPIDNWKDRYLYVNSSGALEPSVNIGTTPLSQSIIADLLYPQTATEISVGATPVDHTYPPDLSALDPRRYGALSPQTVNTAINVASAAGGGRVVISEPFSGAIEENNSYLILMQNDVVLEFLPGSSISLETRDLTNYQIIRCMDVSDWRIIGAVLIGDRDTHAATGGEHGHGIDIRGCTNFVVEDAKCSDMWGDGIYVGASGSKDYSENGLIVNPVCDNNRRQGISLVSFFNVDVINPVLTNTNGTNPQAAIDCEPNFPSGRMVGRIVRPLTSGNVGGGIMVNPFNLDSTSHPVDLIIEDLNSRDDMNGIRVEHCPAGIRGSIVFRSPFISDSHLNGIAVRDWDADGIHVAIESPTVIDAYDGRPTSTFATNGISITMQSGDAFATTLGGVTITQPIVKDTRGTALMQRYIYINNVLSAQNIRGIRIEDPLELSGSTTGQIFWNGEGVVTDRFSQLRYTPPSSFTLNAASWASSVDNAGATGSIVVTLNASYPVGAPSVTLTVMSAQNLRVEPGAGHQIVPDTDTPEDYLQSNTVGSSITLEKRAANQWFVVSKTGTWVEE